MSDLVVGNVQLAPARSPACRDVAIQDVVDTVNHQPLLADEITLVLILERTLAALNSLRKQFPRTEHTQAAGLLRSALSIERKLLAEYQGRCGDIKGAILAASKKADFEQVAERAAVQMTKAA